LVQQQLLNPAASECSFFSCNTPAEIAKCGVWGE